MPPSGYNEEETFKRWSPSHPTKSIQDMRNELEYGMRLANYNLAWRKPSPGDPDVHIYQLTSQVSLRIWGHGLRDRGIYLFDLIRNEDGRDIITPPGWIIVTVPKAMIPYQEMRSLESQLGWKMGISLEEVEEGERYIAMEGMELHFTIPCERSVTVRIPRREGPNIVYHDM